MNLQWITGKVRAGDVYTVFLYLGREFNNRVEGITAAHSWGWNYRAIRGATTLSNHASGTAVDFNAPKHPLGKVGTFTAAQVAQKLQSFFVEIQQGEIGMLGQRIFPDKSLDLGGGSASKA